MNTLRTARACAGLSQRGLAHRAGLSFRGVQLLESPGHDARVSSLVKVAEALGLPVTGIATLLDAFFLESGSSFRSASERMVAAGFASWPLHLFDAVDTFRRTGSRDLVRTAPVASLDPRLSALLASTVETLCASLSCESPGWCRGVGPLDLPWFVSGVENLKATALVESPARYRRRNVFVLANFLERV